MYQTLQLVVLTAGLALGDSALPREWLKGLDSVRLLDAHLVGYGFDVVAGR